MRDEPGKDRRREQRLAAVGAADRLDQFLGAGVLE
jgi:hypothetical protein